MGRTSRQKFAAREQSIFDEVDRELRLDRRIVVWPYIFAGIAIFWIIIIAVAILIASWVLGGYGS